MVSFAVGEVGLSLEEVYGLDFDELGGIMEAYRSKEEAIYRDQWERARFLALCLLTPYQKKGKRLKGTDIMRFPWDSPVVGDRVSAEDLDRISRMFGD